MIAPTTNGIATGKVRWLLRVEGLSQFAAMTILYSVWEGSWWVYAFVFFLPDLSMLGYLFGPRVGALTYNAAHSYILPGGLACLGFATAEPLELSIAMIWLAHIGLDRALGLGLKYGAGFRYTHLGRIGRALPTPDAAQA